MKYYEAFDLKNEMYVLKDENQNEIFSTNDAKELTKKEKSLEELGHEIKRVEYNTQFFTNQPIPSYCRSCPMKCNKKQHHFEVDVFSRNKMWR